jgi:hypothetical protein
MSKSQDPRAVRRAGRLAAAGPAAALLLGVVLAAAAPTLAPAGTAAVADRAVEGQVQRAVEIRLNGERLGRGLVLVERGREGVWMRVADLRHAVDGAGTATRLRSSGRELHASALGGCTACRYRVVRQVVISRRVRVRAGEPYVPLEDVARAFEAKVSQGAGAAVIHLHVGECRWCILEPRPMEAGRVSVRTFAADAAGKKAGDGHTRDVTVPDTVWPGRSAGRG